ncbi:efflux RND transporter permease subunit [Vibrio harveyi]|nr:efflux RND transporter permease subunit [Vibrio harveyi]
MINLAEFAIRQRTFVLFFIALSVVAGIYSYFDLGKLEDPSFTVKTAVVVTLYPGASAQEVEQQVTDTIETKLQEMAELNRLRSLSRTWNVDGICRFERESQFKSVASAMGLTAT